MQQILNVARAKNSTINYSRSFTGLTQNKSFWEPKEIYSNKVNIVHRYNNAEFNHFLNNQQTNSIVESILDLIITKGASKFQEDDLNVRKK